MLPAQATKPNHRILLISVGVALVIIISGSVLAFTNAGFSLAAFAKDLGTNLGLYGNSTFSIKIDRTTLPANGTTQTNIVVTDHRSKPQPIDANVISGGGQIAKVTQTEAVSTFLYTAGSVVGPVEITIGDSHKHQTITLELVEAITPGSPQITSPTEGTATPQLRPDVSGTGPANTKIVISNNGQANTITHTDDQGNFKVRLERPLGSGQQTLSAVAVSDLEISSPPSSLVTIQIQPSPLKVDTANLRISPDRIIAGTSFGIFVPVSLNTEKVLVEFEGTTFELSDSHQSSVFSRTLPAPQNPGSYTASLILVDAADQATRFDNLIQLHIVSS